MGDARDGYDAEMVCRSVQALLPRVATSGGQSEGREAGGGVLVAAAGEGEDVPAFRLVRATQSATEVQERHLH